jgi:hypothetical protein
MTEARAEAAMPAVLPEAARAAPEAAEPNPAGAAAVVANPVAPDAAAIPEVAEPELMAPAPGAGSTDTLFSTAVLLSRNAGKPS